MPAGRRSYARWRWWSPLSPRRGSAGAPRRRCAFWPWREQSRSPASSGRATPLRARVSRARSRLADALHLIAAGVWIGAIAAFLILLRPVADDAGQARLDLAARSLDRFARVGTLCVLTVTATGLVNL
jgi:hypothetical protein